MSKNRAELKSYFVKNAIPTESQFAELIESSLSQVDDGVFKRGTDALGVAAATGDEKRVLGLYATPTATGAEWTVCLNPKLNAAAAAGKPGFGINDGAGNSRLFISPTGNIGVGTNDPKAKLDVAGVVRANRFQSDNTLVLNDYRTAMPASNVYLSSPGNDRDAWLYLDSAGGNSNWGIYHRQIDSAVAGLPTNSIGFVGGGQSKLQAYIGLQDGAGYFAGPLNVGGALDVAGSATLGVARDRPNYNSAAQSGFFQHSSPVGAVPDSAHSWVHLIAVRHSNAANHHQLQLASSYAENNRLYFRKIARVDVTDATSLWNQVVAGAPDGTLSFADFKSVAAPTGILANGLGLGTQTYGAVTYPHETIQLNPGHNLRIWFAGAERFLLENNGQLTIRFPNGRWVFQTDGNLVKYNSAGVAVWFLQKAGGGPGW